MRYSCLYFVGLLITCSSLAQTPSLSSSVDVAALPDAPQAQPAGQQFGTSAQKVPDSRRITPRKYAQVIEPWQKAETFTPFDKVIFSFTEIARPITLLPALYSASYE